MAGKTYTVEPVFFWVFLGTEEKNILFIFVDVLFWQKMCDKTGIYLPIYGESSKSLMEAIFFYWFQ